MAPQGAPSPFQPSPVSKSRFTRQYPLGPRTVLLGCSDSSFRQSIVFWSGVAVLDPKFAQDSESGRRLHLKRIPLTILLALKMLSSMFFIVDTGSFNVTPLFLAFCRS
eukprot:COSAG01_NODE_18781_length_1053_cov_3.518868_2_plen_108_part_00